MGIKMLCEIEIAATGELPSLATNRANLYIQVAVSWG
jgi:hypothetical protein